MDRRIPMVLIILMASALWLLPVEWLSRVWIRSRGDALQRARLLLEPDAHFMWKQRAFLNTKFEGTAVLTDALGFRRVDALTAASKVDEAEVLILGPSSTFGWGVEARETYAQQLADALKMADAGQAGVSNAGEIGYSLLQGRRLYEAISRQRRKPPQWVVLAYGVNDLDRFRFFGAAGEDDSQSLQALSGALGLLWLNRSAFGALLYRSWQEGSYLLGCGLRQEPSTRVPFGEFQSAMREFVARIRADGAQVILLNTPYREAPVGDPVRPEAISELYQAGLNARARGRCLEALRLGAAARQEERRRIAWDVPRLNRLFEETGGKELGVPVVDAYAALAGPERDRQFVDPVHPSASGHQRIARLLFDVISRHSESTKTSGQARLGF